MKLLCSILFVLYIVSGILPAWGQTPRYRLVKEIDKQIDSNKTVIALNVNFFYKKDRLYSYTVDSSSADIGVLYLDSFAYDSQNREIQHLSLSQEVGVGFTYLYKDRYTYSAKSTQLVSQNFDHGTWNNNNGTTVYKNNDGTDSLFIFQQFFNNQWRDNYLKYYHYKAGLVRATETKDSSATLLSTDSFFYDAGRNLIKTATYYPGLQTVGQTFYSYNSQDQLVTKTTVSHDNLSLIDDPKTRSVYTYNSQGQIYFLINQEFNDSSFNWMPVTVDTNFYDTHGNLASDHNCTFQNGSLADVSGRENSFFYYEAFIPVDAVPVPEPARVACYPNPMGPVLNVSFTKPVDKGIVTCYTLDGRQAFSRELNTSGGTTAYLDTGMLAPGMYLLYFQTSIGFFTARVIKQ